jgi:tetratricopeptide (TPR) repeat protein
LISQISRWCRGEKVPGTFYQELLCTALELTPAELGFEVDWHVDGAEPEDLAQALEASNVGKLALDQLEASVVSLGEQLPSTPPASLRRRLLEDCRRITSWLQQPQPVAVRRRLCTAAAQLAGMAGNVSFDLNEPLKAHAYYRVALEAAEQAADPAVSAWVLGNTSYLRAHEGAAKAALEAAQGAVSLAARCSGPTTEQGWLAALEAESYATLGDEQSTLRALRSAERALEQAQPDSHRPGIDFFTAPRLLAYAGSCYRLLGQPQLAERFSVQALDQLDPNARTRSFVRIDLAATFVDLGDVERAYDLMEELLTGLSPSGWTPRLIRRTDEFRQALTLRGPARTVDAFDEQLRLAERA